jgi:DNA-binding CsgD family transcriptional regulator
MQRHMCQPENITRIPFYCHPDHQLNGAFCSSAVINDDWENNLDILQQNFAEQDRRFLIINRKNFVDNSILAFVCSLNSHPSPESLFVTQLNLINLFFTHFVNELAPVFSILEKHSVNLHQVIGTDRFMLAPFGEVQKRIRKEVDTLEDVGLLPVGSRLIHQLSKQELRCFLALLEHDSSREIGASLSLSSRTVEHYLENIKNKVTVDSRKELRNLALALRSLSYI